MERTRTAGTLMRTEADYQLYLLSIWYENQPDRALALLEELRSRHPHNPLFVVNRAQLLRGVQARLPGRARGLPCAGRRGA